VSIVKNSLYKYVQTKNKIIILSEKQKSSSQKAETPLKHKYVNKTI